MHQREGYGGTDGRDGALFDLTFLNDAVAVTAVGAVSKDRLDEGKLGAGAEVEQPEGLAGGVVEATEAGPIGDTARFCPLPVGNFPRIAGCYFQQRAETCEIMRGGTMGLSFQF